MTNRTKQVRRVKRRNNNKDGFIFTNNLNLIKPYVKYHICIENFLDSDPTTLFFTTKILVSH